ncbi:MAG: PAS domain-containing protein [Magnetococcales bacterium]|nr:PAS domain-containing protein [Magnetococcales bacterium]
MKIRTRATLHVLPALLLLLVGAIFLQYVIFRFALEAEIRERLRAVVAIQQKRVDALLEQAFERLHWVADQTDLPVAFSRYLEQRGDGPRHETQAILATLLHTVPSTRRIILSDLSGTVLFSSDPNDIDSGHPPAGQSLTLPKGVVVEDPYWDETGELNIRLKSPIFRESRLLGLLLVEFRLGALLEVLQDDSGLGRGSETLLVRGEGGTLRRVVPVRSPAVPSASNPVVEVGVEPSRLSSSISLTEGRDLWTGVDDQGRPVLFVARPLGKADWTLIARVTSAETHATREQTWNGTLILLVGTALVGSLLLLLRLRGLVRPLENACRDIGRVGKGEMDPPVVCNQPDELGDLVAAFNALTERLGEINRRVQEKNRLLERNQGERERLEHHYQETAFLLENLFANRHLHVAHMDPRGNFLRVNQLYADAGGYPAEFYVGRNCFDLFPDPTLAAGFRQALATGKPWVVCDHPFVFPGSDGRAGSFWDCSLTPLRLPRGEASGLFLQLLDVTRRKESVIALEESDKRYRGLFENAPIPYWEEDLSHVRDLLEELVGKEVEDLGDHLRDHPDLFDECLRRVRITDVNRASLMLYGASDQEQFQHNLPRIMTPESTRSFIDGLITLFDGDEFYACESRHRTLNGKVLRTMVHVMLTPGHEADWSRVLVCVLDLTPPDNPEGI